MLSSPKQLAFSVFLAAIIHNVVCEWPSGKWLLFYLFSHSAPQPPSSTWTSALRFCFIPVHFLPTRGPQHLFDHSLPLHSLPWGFDIHLALCPVPCAGPMSWRRRAMPVLVWWKVEEWREGTRKMRNWMSS